MVFKIKVVILYYYIFSRQNYTFYSNYANIGEEKLQKDCKKAHNMVEKTLQKKEEPTEAWTEATWSENRHSTLCRPTQHGASPRKARGVAQRKTSILGEKFASFDDAPFHPHTFLTVLRKKRLCNRLTFSRH